MTFNPPPGPLPASREGEESDGARKRHARLLLLASSCLLLACGHGDARFPKRPDGCDVQLFRAAPTMPTENIGPVQARCGEDIPKPDCERTLKDAVCALGGDVVWGVEEPKHEDGQFRYVGRAAHTKAAAH